MSIEDLFGDFRTKNTCETANFELLHGHIVSARNQIRFPWVGRFLVNKLTQEGSTQSETPDCDGGLLQKAICFWNWPHKHPY
jgi:hypothetical protein